MQIAQRIYYLDLLRALAITLVFVGHTIFSYGPTLLTAPLQFGGTGVDLFFLLSGWLIGSQLFAEHKKHGSIDIKRFWIRRWMRTFPAYFAVLFFTLGQLYLTKDNVQNPLPYFTFTQNYFGTLPYFSVSWSLAVEEQFYLAIAPIIALLFYLKKKSIHLTILLTLLIMPTFFRTLGWYESSFETHVRWDCCLMGVLLAFTYHHMPTVWEKMSNNKSTLLILGLGFYILFFYFRWAPPTLNYTDPSKLILAIIFAALVIYAVATPIKRLPLFHKAIMHVSTRSYSIYLLHAIPLSISKKIIPDLPLVIYFLIALILTLVISEILYRTVEVGFINLRENYAFSQKRTSLV
jgi:peptidoglycan/LPS O-acetylase OafA/YrhL